MPKKSKYSSDEEEDDLDAALLSLVTTDKGKRRKGNEEGELSDEAADKRKKKRKSDAGASSDENSDEEFNDGYDDDLMGDEADRAYLEGLSEIKREQILHERYIKRKELQERYELKKKLQREKGVSQSPSSKRETRAKDKSAVAKQRAMKDLRKKREEKERQKVYRESSDEEEEEEFSEKESDDDFVAKDDHKPKDRKKDKPPKKDIPKTDEEKAPNAIGLEDLNKMCLKRTFLERKVEEPYFDAIVIGFFVRIGIGKNNDNKPIYRLAQITEVKEIPSKKYTLGKKVTNKHLVLKHGNSSKSFPMDNVSNQAVLESEFSRWKAEMQKHNLSLPTVQTAKEKEDLLTEAEKYVITNEDIEKMIERNRSLSKLPVNVAAEKVQLMAKRDAARDAGNTEEYDKTTQRLAELEELRSTKIAIPENKTSKINQRNKFVNITTKFEDIREAASELHDPFSRRITRAAPTFKKPITSDEANSLVAASQPQEELPKTTEPTEPESSADSNNNNNNNSLQSQSQPWPRLEMEIDHPEILLKTAHDFDIELPSRTVDAKLAPLVSKPLTVNNPANGSTKTRSLSVNDYKIRRGLF